MANVYYAFDVKNYKHYLIGNNTIWQFNVNGADCKELEYMWLPIMQYMSPNNVVSVLYATNGVNSQLEIAYNYNNEFGKYSKDAKDIMRCLNLGSMQNCIAKLQRNVGSGVLQTVFVFNLLETNLFELLKAHKF